MNSGIGQLINWFLFHCPIMLRRLKSANLFTRLIAKEPMKQPQQRLDE